MLNEDSDKLFPALVSAFPQSDIIIFSPQGFISHSLRRLYILDPSNFTTKESISVITVENLEYYLISLYLPDSARLLIVLQAQEYESRASTLAMVLSLEQALFLVEQQPNCCPSRFSLFINQLLIGSMQGEQSLCSSLAKELHIDLTIPRLVCIIQLTSLPEVLPKKNEVISCAVKLIRSLRFISPNDLVCKTEDNNILLCHQITPGLSAVKSQCFEELLHIRRMLMSRLGKDTRIGTGFIAIQPEEYAQSYTAALQILQFSDQLPSKIAFAVDCFPELVVGNTSPDILKHFLQESADFVCESPALLQTIEALVTCSMNLTEAANQLYIHRNTMAHRMKQLHSALDLDPLQSDNDRSFLHLLLNYCKKQD